MATFSSSPVASPFAPANALFSVAGVDQAVQGSQRNALVNAGLQREQDYANEVSALAPQIASGDRSALMQAATLGAPGAQAVQGVTAAQTANAAQTRLNMESLGRLGMAVAAMDPEHQEHAYGLIAPTLKGLGIPVPDQYPGPDAIRNFATMAISPEKMFEAYQSMPSTDPRGGFFGGMMGGGAAGAQPGYGAGQAGAQPSATQAPGSGGFRSALAQTESGGNPASVNSDGYAGLYQFGTARLADLGMYHPAPGESLKNNQWSGTLSIPGFEQVHTLNDFLHNPAAQQAAYQTHEGNIDQAIDANPGAAGYDRDGLRAVAHLGGVEGMNRFVESAGRHNPADRNGTSLGNYYRRFSSGTPVGAQQAGSSSPITGEAAAPPAAGAPVQVASATNTNGAPAIASDAAPASVSGLGPTRSAPPVNNLAGRSAARPGPALNATTQNALLRIGSTPDPDSVVPVDPANAGISLPSGTAYSVDGRPAQVAGPNGGVVVPVPGQPGTVQQVPGAGRAQPAGGQLMGQSAGQAQPGGAFVIGDSIGQGVAQANGLQGVYKSGAPPQAVLGMITGLPANALQGRNVIISTGASNNVGDTSLVEQQVDAAKAKGATSITLVGVGPHDSYVKAGTNDKLAALAQQNGIAFTGPLTGTDAQGIHPRNYRGLGLNMQPVAAPPFGNSLRDLPGTTPSPRPVLSPAAASMPQTPAGAAIAATPTPYVPPTIQNTAGGTNPGAQPRPAVQPPMTAEAATAQAEQELAGQTASMSPTDANDAVATRAAQLMQGGQGGEQTLPTPAGGGPQRNALLGATSPAPAAFVPNALAQAGAPQQSAPASQTGSTSPAASPRTFDPNTAQTLYVQGKPIGFPGMAGFVMGQDANGNRGPVRAGTPKLSQLNVGGTIVYSDPVTGKEVSRNVVGNTGRLMQLPDGRGGTIVVGPNGQPITRGGNTLALDLGKQDYERDQRMIPEASTELAQLRQQELTLRDARDVSQGLQQTGFFGAGKAQAASLIASTFGPDTAHTVQGILGLDDPSSSEQFNKLMFSAASAQENQNVGARGGYNLTKAYAAANPGLQSQKETIRDILNVQSIANLMHQDYTQGLLDHVAQQSQGFRTGGDYQPSGTYQAQWARSNQPRVFLAAAEALNQQPFAKWSKGLSQDEQQQALGIAARVNNTASYNGPQGDAALTRYGAPGGDGQGGGAQASTPAPAAPAGPPGPPPGAVGYLRQNPGMAAAFDAKYGAGASRQVLGR